MAVAIAAGQPGGSRWAGSPPRPHSARGVRSDFSELAVVTRFPVNLRWSSDLPPEVPDTDAIHVATEFRVQALVDEVRSELSTDGLPGLDTIDVRLVVCESRLVLGSVALHRAMRAPGPVMPPHPQRSGSAAADPDSQPAMAGH
jgi:hypothetical protein